MNEPISPMLSGVPQTLSWTLHNRAAEARRRKPLLQDPDAVAIQRATEFSGRAPLERVTPVTSSGVAPLPLLSGFDFARHFGRPDASHAIRSRVFDDALRPWLAAHPGGTVVELGCGLETQVRRCDDGRVRWLGVDLPEVIALRERFLPPGPRCQHLATSVLDLRWTDAVDPGCGVFVSAQGLFMYLEEREVQRLVSLILERWPAVTLMFDTIPTWFAARAARGFWRTRHYRAPPMPWGIDRPAIAPTLRAWSRRVRHVELVSWGYARGIYRVLLPLFRATPGLRNLLPSIVRVDATA